MVKIGWYVETKDTLECDWCGSLYPHDEKTEEWSFCPCCGDYKKDPDDTFINRVVSKISIDKRRKFLDLIGIEVGGIIEDYTENWEPKNWFHEVLDNLVYTIYGEDDEQ